VDRARFDEYIRRFNAEDATGFDEFIAQNLRMQNGTLVFHGVQGMKDHYAKIWGTFRETLTVERFVSDDESVAIQMWANFMTLKDVEESVFGAMRKGEQLDFRGIIMYRLVDGRFADIRVAYNSFTFTGLDGEQVERGIPH
jgi:hypothetical protein